MEELNEERGDLLLTLTPDQWERVKSHMQTLIETMVVAGLRKMTILVAEIDESYDLEAIRYSLSETAKWQRDGLLIMSVEDEMARLEIFVPLFPTVEEASKAGLIDATGMLTGHEN